jgi:hypothetical protein
MYPHRIRLRGPWECEPLARTGPNAMAPLPPACRMVMPCRWHEGGLTNFTGRVRFRRRFGYPGRIDTYERVWLTFAGAEDSAEIWLNGRHLGRYDKTGEPFAVEVTALLERRNEWTVEVEGTSGRGGLWGEVALEVRCTAYLHSVRVWLEETSTGQELHVTGKVVGTAERPLDLYMLGERSTLAYDTVVALPEGQPFHLRSGPVAPGTVRIELVHAATVWYVVERTV